MPAVDLEIRAAEQLMHHTTSLSPFFVLSCHCALSVAHKIARDGHVRSLVGNLPSPGHEIRDDGVRVKHNPCLGFSPYGIQEASCGTFRSGRVLMFDRFETHPRIERKASSVASFPRLVGMADLFLPPEYF